MNEAFHKVASRIAHLMGTPVAFLVALGVIVIWAATGPLLHFSDTWQLVINTSTTIITFLMVFLIQNTQNRDAKALHLKLDELICANKKARNNMVNVEELSDAELEQLQRDFDRMGKHVREERKDREREPSSRRRESKAEAHSA